MLKNTHLSRPVWDCPSSLVIAAYNQVHLIPWDSGALHLGIFEHPAGNYFFSSLSE
jgi:hypothetical protein